MSISHTEDRIEEIVAIDLNQPVDISIENQNGDVVVRGTDRTDVLIRAEKHGNSASTSYQEAVLLIETGAARISVSPLLPGQGRAGPSVSVDFGLDFGPDFLRDLIDPTRRHDDRERRRQGRRERKGRGFSVTWDSNVSYEIEIEVPRALVCRLAINTASGDVEINDITGDIELSTASGDASINQIDGSVRYNTASGDLGAQRIAGALTGRSASGDVRIEQSAVNAFGFHTASGDLFLDAALTGDGPYQIETASGDSQLAIAGIDPTSGRERAIAITFRSMSGDARLGPEFRQQGSGRWATEAAMTGPTMNVSTMSGNLRGSLGVSRGAVTLARQASDLPDLGTSAPAGQSASTAPPSVVPPMAPAAPVAPMAPPAPPAPEPPAPPAAERIQDTVHTGGPLAEASEATAAAERLALLEAVERGEIDIEEALQRLEDRKDTDPDSD